MMFFRSKETNVQRRAHAILKQLDKDIADIECELKDTVDTLVDVSKELQAYVSKDYFGFAGSFDSVGLETRRLIKELKQLGRERGRFKRVVNGT